MLRRRLAPSLSELGALSTGVFADPVALLAGQQWAERWAGGIALDEIGAEHAALRAELDVRYRSRQLPFPTNWAVEAGTSLLLYALVRGLRPHVVVELGVGNGQSSYYILRALQANGAGRLHSFDIESEAGGLLSDRERADWDFRLIERWRAGASLTSHLGRLPEACLCFHDAGHGYLAQRYEFEVLWNHLRDDGILVGDDVDLSYALIDFCEIDGKRPELLVDRRKAIAILRRFGPIHAAGSADERRK